MAQTTIIVPIYNEEKRAVTFLNELVEFCKSHNESYKIILVNDGSEDGTLSLLRLIEKSNNDLVQIISYQENKGKGYAVRCAILTCMTEYVIFIDSDGSISTNEIPKILEELENFDVVVGSRALKNSKVNQPIYRKLTAFIFNFLVNIIFSSSIKDNLCGIKGFNKQAAHILFSKLQTNRWIFDVEIFYRIRKEKFTLQQIPISWKYKSGSKIRFYDPFLMFINLISLRLKLIFCVS